ncbi:MAG TPA: proton-conducting transporter membrane subunit, partial [Nannocystis sp.]
AALATGHLTFAAVTAALPASSLADPVIALTLAGFGIKAGALPLHVWLPLAHPAAPTPASAVLSGAMIKAGLLGWLRLLPAGQVALPGWGQLVLVLGLLAAFLAAAVGIVQRDPKAVLAYSSISQMGWMMLGLGIGLATPTAWPAVLTALQLFALHHALAKGALFLGVGVGSARGEHARFRAFVHTGLLLPALALAGAPWTTGAAAKSALHAATEAAPAPWPTWLHALLPLASLATGLLMARFLVLVWPPPRDAPLRLPASALAAWSVLWVIPLGVLWFAPIPAFRHAIRDTVSLAATWASLWPVLLAAAIAWRSARSPRARQLLARLSIPPGDLVVLVERATTALLARLRAVQAARRRLPRSAWTARLRRTALRCGDVAARGESIVARWTVGAVLFVILTALLAFLLHGDLDQTPPAATDLAPVEAPAAARPRRLPHRPARLRARQPGLHLAHAVRHRYVCSNMFI